ncbi:hypothetical protein H6P81_017766 [Aristolochia fimbriata]|uniref:Uncharacterized protein n=1 Tax=Aristolochia fimbriata TaxID=158543 RepID=A0AAV7E3D5_ARIFI|nr:hypothetical protein H6P81_017766 [Aristolochia fimbriata]
MMEYLSSDSASEDDVPRRSTESSFAFMESVWSFRLEDHLGLFFRLDHEGKPIVNVKGASTIALQTGAWTNVGFSNELIFYRLPSISDWDDDFDPNIEYTYNCYVANGALMQVMPIPSHPYELDGEYSIVALGLSSSFDSDCWKLIAVLKSNSDSRTFCDDEFAKVGTFDLETRAWSTEQTLFSDEFKYYFESYSDSFYLTSSPVCHGEALYWVHGWNAKGPDIASGARHPWNVDVPVPGREFKLRPLSLLKLCLKTNL